jgi:type III restriction enzyme
MKKIKIQFDPNQQHQLDAIQNTVDLFQGISAYELVAGTEGNDYRANVGQYFCFETQTLLGNLNLVQERHSENQEYSSSITSSVSINLDSGGMVQNVSLNSWEYPSFTINMETGTGKTYVYLRTIFALKKQVGFSKFIIVVPSVAIFEGVLNSWKALETHLRSLFENEPANLVPFEGDKMNMIWNFAKSPNLEILVMTIDSFKRVSNKIYKECEGFGEQRPYQTLQDLRPILILDESQNYETEISKNALRTLKPLFALKYSATPITLNENRIYTLSPVDAFKKNLVKKIEVLGVYDLNRTHQTNDSLYLKGIYHNSNNQLQADIRLIVNQNGQLREATLPVSGNSNLFTSTRNEAYRGITVREINLAEGFIELSNDLRLDLNQGQLSIQNEYVFRVQIRETIKKHFSKQEQLLPFKTKVLTLFFIDKVANYVGENGILKQIFEEEFRNLKEESGTTIFKKQDPKSVHKGYFAKKPPTKKDPGGFVDIEEGGTTEEQIAMEAEAFSLIMKEKERLLSFEEEVSFIFAHSALKEGWDNPNVFQICVLREISTDRQRRQTIGRGMRLPVDQEGNRIFDRDLNILTVIANDSYANYAAQLQREYREAGDVNQEIPIANAAQKKIIERNEKQFENLDFEGFWKKLIRKTEYSIHIDTKALIEETIGKLNRNVFPNPKVQITEGAFVISNYTISIESGTEKHVNLKLEMSTTSGQNSSSVIQVKEKDDIGKKSRIEVYNGFKIKSIKKIRTDLYVEIDKLGELRVDHPISFSTERGQSVQTREEEVRIKNLPKFNLIERTCKEVTLTRDTVLKIFLGMKDEKKKKFLENPEGFAGVFIKTLKEVLADHIADRIEYELLNEYEDYPMDHLFPPTEERAENELVSPRENASIYNFIQTDSDVERQFVNVLNSDEKVVLYFKFPPKYKIHIPKIIGNYNPDWAILRWDDSKNVKLELVRETKGGSLDKLQFPNEKRKIQCAEKHFSSVGVSYRPIIPQFQDWWKNPVKKNPNEFKIFKLFGK